jgi:hypothetical protein
MSEFANVFFFLLKGMIFGTFFVILYVALFFLACLTLMPLFVCVEKSKNLLSYANPISGYEKTIMYTKVTLLNILGLIGTKISLSIWGFIIYWLTLNDFQKQFFLLIKEVK